jgi:hypothetical protein
VDDEAASGILVGSRLAAMTQIAAFVELDKVIGFSGVGYGVLAEH